VKHVSVAPARREVAQFRSVLGSSGVGNVRFCVSILLRFFATHVMV
jgi:hypothetical protein